jgi:hypothetical protein
MSWRLVARLIISVAGAVVGTQTVCAQGRTDPCRAAQHLRIGQWASYDVTGGPRPGQARLAIVGSEDIGDSTFLWLEIRYKSDEPKHESIVQLLVTVAPEYAGSVRDMVMKTDTLPAVRVSSEMLAGMGRQIAQSTAALRWRERCTSSEIVGWESLVLPVGTIHALHLRSENGDVWAAADVPFAIVKVLGRDGTETVLTGRGADAKSSITERPRERPGVLILPP